MQHRTAVTEASQQFVARLQHIAELLLAINRRNRATELRTEFDLRLHDKRTRTVETTTRISQFAIFVRFHFVEELHKTSLIDILRIIDLVMIQIKLSVAHLSPVVLSLRIKLLLL